VAFDAEKIFMPRGMSIDFRRHNFAVDWSGAFALSWSWPTTLKAAGLGGQDWGRAGLSFKIAEGI